MSETPGNEMPFLDHLEELRHRLFWIAGAVVIGVVVAFILLSKLDIIRLLERPILPLLHGQKLIYTHPGTSFHILLNASLVLGIILASPVVVGQLWGFLAPALYAQLLSAYDLPIEMSEGRSLFDLSKIKPIHVAGYIEGQMVSTAS